MVMNLHYHQQKIVVMTPHTPQNSPFINHKIDPLHCLSVVNRLLLIQLSLNAQFYLVLQTLVFCHPKMNQHKENGHQKERVASVCSNHIAQQQTNQICGGKSDRVVRGNSECEGRVPVTQVEKRSLLRLAKHWGTCTMLHEGRGTDQDMTLRSVQISNGVSLWESQA